MTQAEALVWARSYIRPEEARWLMEALVPFELATFQAWVQQVKEGVHVAHLTHRWDFLGRAYYVNEAVLIPRSDTEAWVDQLLAETKEGRDWAVLELGTGSGVIAISLALARPDWSVTAVELSRDALAVSCRNNAEKKANVVMMESDWWAAVTGSYELIVSNPPYLSLTDPHLPSLQAEPAMALVSGVDGLDAMRTIIASAPAYLRPGGQLWLEHGCDQGAAVRALYEAHGFEAIRTIRDWSGRARASVAVY
jgi:release factor glutamine methyltransferase